MNHPAPTNRPAAGLLDGIGASLHTIDGLFRISAFTLFDAFRDGVRRDRSDARIAWWARSVVEGTPIDLRVRGRERLEGGKTFLLMSNHQSHYDIPVLFHAVSSSIRMVTKTELFRLPIFGPALREAGFIEIDRSNRHQAIASLRRAREALRAGVHVWIAPEGTRSRTGELLPFKKGGFMLAVEAKLPILPVGIAGTRDVLPADAWLTSRGRRVGVAIGEPISPEGKRRDELMAETRRALEALVAEAEALRA
ncbi:MAG TPA: lysophospholipid acyltransferase family protein [Polyangiaceae bacterium]|nr:lysophospholipid acyltransferase family protein [Polyangiaceae bacterium]